MTRFEPSKKIMNDLQILLYVCSFLKAARPHINNPLLYAAKAAKQNCSKLRLKLQTLSLDAFFDKVTLPSGFEFDLNAVVLVSSKTALNLSVRNCQWLNVKYYIKFLDDPTSYEKLEVSSKFRWILIYICPELRSDQCFASPVLYHNLIQNTSNCDIVIEFINDIRYFMSTAFQKILMLWQNAHTSAASPEDEDIQSCPQHASEVQVKYVESLKYRCGNYTDSLISDYFSIPKAVTVSDVLVIPVPSHLAYEFIPSSSIIPPRFIFIKVSSVKGRNGSESQQTMLVVKNVTNLYLSGATRCSLPLLTGNITSDGKKDIPPILDSTYHKIIPVMKMDLNIASQDLNLSVCEDCKEKEKNQESEFLVNFGNEGEQVDTETKNQAAVLFLGPSGSGVEELVNLAAASLGLEVLWIDVWHLKGDTSGVTEARLRQTFLRAASQSPCVLALQNIHCIAKDHDGHEDSRVVGALKDEVLKLHSGVFLVATAPHRSQVSSDLWSIWSHQESVEVPDLPQRSLMLDWLFSHWVNKAEIQTLAQRSAGYIYGDFLALFHAAQRMCLHRLASSGNEEANDVNLTSSKTKGVPIVYSDVQNALDELQSCRSEALGAPRIPQVTWKEVGGLEEAKREVVNTIQLPLRYPSLVSSGLRRSGVLLYGPPGTGKTLLAKAVATECGLNFMSVKGPELLNMYVGQSEENVRQVFSRARAAAPCVIFFDELDSLAPNRGRSGDSGGVMDRIVSALLAELDGVANSSDVFVLAATNRPDLIDPALLRPGRFEKLVFLGVCEDRSSQIKILQAVATKVPLAEDVSLERVVKMLPLTLTGADIYALCTDALYSALQRTTQQISTGEVKEEEAEFYVGEEDFKRAAEQLVPSVTPRELIHYRNLSTNKR
ncbi:peroxisomal assembly protein [Halocaridina rubra]|uniref:Peroxisomal ATPase PEX6 n=1 Tax=Halocaridina rubra TaxID=373956 RepID=A0AAN8WPX0_HALRR